MAIAFGSIGAKSAGVTASPVTISYPASPGAGDLAITGRVGWLNSIILSSVAGWDSRGATSGGTGTTADNHTTEVGIDTREMTGSESGSVAFGLGGTISGALGIMARYTKDPAATWDIVASGSNDSAHGTNRSFAGVNLSLAPGDLIVAVVAVDTDAALTITSPTFTATGITFGTVNRRTSGAGVTSGVDGNIEWFDVAVTDGSGSPSVVFSFTTATSQCGSVQYLRLREDLPPAPASIVTAPMVAA